MSRVAYSIEQAAAEVSQSPKTIRRAIQSTDPRAFPPPLRAKRQGKAKNAAYLIGHDALMEWFHSLPDA